MFSFVIRLYNSLDCGSLTAGGIDNKAGVVYLEIFYDNNSEKKIIKFFA